MTEILDVKVLEQILSIYTVEKSNLIKNKELIGKDFRISLYGNKINIVSDTFELTCNFILFNYFVNLFVDNVFYENNLDKILEGLSYPDLSSEDEDLELEFFEKLN